MIFLAHGIGGVRDLPVPESFFFTTAAIVLVVGHALLEALQALRDVPHHGREAISAEQQEDDDRKDQDMPEAERTHG